MICSQKEINKIIQTGSAFSGKYLKFIYIKNSQVNKNLELVISIPKKHIKLAVTRNQIKRRIKSFFIQENKKMHTNLKLIIVYKTISMKYIIIKIIEIYQMFISPLLGKNCRHLPTCSNYCIGAVKKHGVLKGAYFSIKRILCCHPFGTSGYDPVP